ncbi:MAG: hypothetical protein Q7Q73_11265 [Verrucomicrobiota bacterium JB024]|nr:hypothetical protein [Verrucomicrobiota bacterium JB024]
MVSDAFGHTVGWLDTQTTAGTDDDAWEWQQVQLTGYGPHKGFATPVLAHAMGYNLADHLGAASDMG